MFVFDLINFVVGAGAGMVVAVLVPKVFSWVGGEVKAVEASATKVESVVANTVANTVISKL